MKTKEKQVAVLAGATGLVGRQILRLLSEHEGMEEVRALVRRSLRDEDRKPLVRECRIDFDHLQDHPDWFKADLVFSALGTTIHQAGSQEAFHRVDFEYTLAIAKAARAQGARHFLFVSALGADAKSVFFYNRVKGELEEAILALDYPSVTIARPSLLLGERPKRRFGEELAKKVGWLAPSTWRPVYASQVAAALVRSADADEPGVHILDNVRLRSEEKELV